jgi:hypothetical protein
MTSVKLVALRRVKTAPSNTIAEGLHVQKSAKFHFVGKDQLSGTVYQVLHYSLQFEKRQRKLAWKSMEKTIHLSPKKSRLKSKTILATKIRDDLREKWFKENKKKLVIIWEDELDTAIERLCK